MKTVPLQDLKQRLSAFIGKAEAGERIVVTRHGRPVAMLTPASEQHVTLGARFGTGALRQLFTRPATRGRYLAALAEDRDEGPSGR